MLNFQMEGNKMNWDDPYYKSNILKAGERRKKEKPPEVKEIMELKKCKNCGKPFLVTVPDHCKCSPWEVR